MFLRGEKECFLGVKSTRGDSAVMTTRMVGKQGLHKNRLREGEIE